MAPERFAVEAKAERDSAIDQAALGQSSAQPAGSANSAVRIAWSRVSRVTTNQDRQPET
jgi:hypothetical protein